MIEIRKAEPGDAAALVTLAESVGSEAEQWILSTDTWRTIADERRYVKSVYRHPDAAVYVAEEEGRVLARMSLARDPHPASRHVADLGLMVAAEHRRRGIGTMLLDTAVAWAEVSGVTKLELHVFPWNEPALRLYESFGFEREGFRKQHYERDGQHVDAILMALVLE